MYIDYILVQWDDGFVDEGHDIYSELENPQAPSPLPNPSTCSISSASSDKQALPTASTAPDNNNMSLSLIEEEVSSKEVVCSVSL